MATGTGTKGHVGQLADENALLRASLAEMRERVEELEGSADRDPMTGLANRRRFLAEVERAVGQADRHGVPAAIALFDVKGMNAINRARGRFAGDAALIHVANLLAGLIRSTDIAARVGDDEFALLLGHLDHNSAIETAERLARCIAANPVDLGGASVALEAWIGVATILAGDSVNGVIDRAERNLFRTKRED